MMKIVAFLLCLFMPPMFLPQTAMLRAQQKPEDLAQKSAEAWLALTDSAKYAESWEEASTNLKAAVTKDKWIGMLQSVRSPLGSLNSRKLNSAKFAKNPPKAPEGEYVILTFDTSFENLPSAIETISTFLDQDGKWHVAGYFIKPASQ
jgi:hypothetical protein